MIDPQAFLDMIRTDPRADGPRLVYADWLEEQGLPLAELIRVQVELAKLPPSIFVGDTSLIVESNGSRASLRGQIDWRDRMDMPEEPAIPVGLLASVRAVDLRFLVESTPYIARGVLDRQEMDERTRIIRVEYVLLPQPTFNGLVAYSWPDPNALLREREAWLLSQHRTNLLSFILNLLDFDRDRANDFTIQRGFIHKIRLHFDEYLLHVRTLFNLMPIEQLIIRGWTPVVDDTADEARRWDEETVLRLPQASWLKREPLLEQRLKAMLKQRFATRDEADAALSNALVDAGRVIVGLPELYASFSGVVPHG